MPQAHSKTVPRHQRLLHQPPNACSPAQPTIVPYQPREAQQTGPQVVQEATQQHGRGELRHDEEEDDTARPATAPSHPAIYLPHRQAHEAPHPTSPHHAYYREGPTTYRRQ